MATTTEAVPGMSPGDAARLSTWFSPSFPIGAYSYSHGLEHAVEHGDVVCEASLGEWLADLLAFGSARNDIVLFRASFGAGGEGGAAGEAPDWLEVAELGAAMTPTAELALETKAQGAAFLRAVQQAWPTRALETRIAELAEADLAVTQPVAVALCCRIHDLPLRGSLTLYVQAFVANLVSAGVRLIPLGQAAGQRVIAALEAPVEAAAAWGSDAVLADLGSATPLAEIHSMQHETQYTRLFRS